MGVNPRNPRLPKSLSQKGQNTSCNVDWVCYIPRSVSPASKAGDVYSDLTQNADNQSVGPQGPP
jgi:hypothetical protein